MFLEVIIDTDAAAASAAAAFAAASGFTTVLTVVSRAAAKAAAAAEAAAEAAAASVSIITSRNTRLTGIKKRGIYCFTGRTRTADFRAQSDAA